MRCLSCGAELLAGAKFCHACGTRTAQTCPSCEKPIRPEFVLPGMRIRARPCQRSARAAATTDAATRRCRRGSARSADAPHPRRARAEDPRRRARWRASASSSPCSSATSSARRRSPSGSTPRSTAISSSEYLELAFREIYRFEGIVNQLAGDGFMALFGAPVAHEDAPHRAVCAALAIRDALERPRRAGRGRARHRAHSAHRHPHRSGRRRHASATTSRWTTPRSATRRTSPRACSRSPRRAAILISEATHRLVRGFFERAAGRAARGQGQERAGHGLRGASARSDVTTPMAIAEARGLTPLVGRERRAGAARRACFGRLAGGSPQVVAVVGDAGSGKSRLIYEFTAAARRARPWRSSRAAARR